MAGSATPLDLPEGADLYLVNDDDLTYGTTRPAPQGRDRLFALAGRLPTPIGRGVAAATFHDMLLAGEASTQEVLHALIGVARAERSPGRPRKPAGRAGRPRRALEPGTCPLRHDQGGRGAVP